MFDCQYIRRALVLRQGLTLNGDNSWSTYRIHTIQCRFVHEFQARVFQHDDEDWGGVAVKEQPLSMNRGMTPISEPKEKKWTKRSATTAQNAFYNDILITNFPRFFSLLPLLFGCVKTFFFVFEHAKFSTFGCRLWRRRKIWDLLWWFRFNLKCRYHHMGRPFFSSVVLWKIEEWAFFLACLNCNIW